MASPSRRTGPARALVVMPTYNEIESLERTVNALFDAVADVDLLIVDDSSPDGTGSLADRLAAADPRIHVLHRREKDGLGRAYLAGFAWAHERGYTAVVEMDADGSHPAASLPAMLASLDGPEGPGLVIGSRWVAGGSVVNWPLRRLILSRGANTYARIALGIPVRDITAGYRVYRDDLLTRIIGDDVDSRGYCFQIDLTIRAYDAGSSIIEIPIEFREREAGASKMSGDIVFKAMSKVTMWGLQRLFRRPRSKRRPAAVGESR